MHILSGSQLCTIPSHQDNLIPAGSEEAKESCNSRIPNWFSSFQERSPLHCFSTNPPSVPYRSKVFLKQPVQHCSDIKVTGGDLSCSGAVRLTVTQLTDSQTTRDPCSYFFFSPVRHSFLYQCNLKNAKLILLIIH